MDEVEVVATSVWNKIASVFTMEIYNGKSLADLLTLETMLSLLGNTIAAILILCAGFIVSGVVSRRITRLGRMHESLDDTLFIFFGNIARYTILAFTSLFVLNTFGVRTTSVVAVIGAAGLATGLALPGPLSNVAAGVMLILFGVLIATGSVNTIADWMIRHVPWFSTIL